MTDCIAMRGLAILGSLLISGCVGQGFIAPGSMAHMWQATGATGPGTFVSEKCPRNLTCTKVIVNNGPPGMEAYSYVFKVKHRALIGIPYGEEPITVYVIGDRVECNKHVGNLKLSADPADRCAGPVWVRGDQEIRAALATVSPTSSPVALPQPSPPTAPPAQSARPSSEAPPSLPSDAVSSFEAQLDALADLKGRGRITEDEYQAMRRRLVEGVKPESLAPAEANLSSPPPRPQPVRLQWFLGNWQGRQWREGTGEVLTTLLELKHVGHEVRWEMFTPPRQYMATGTATLIGERLELRGSYFGGSTPNRVLTLTLTKTGETLEGTGRGLENVPFLASYQRRGP